MFIQQLTLYNFKNYTRSAFNFSNKVNCFTGLNGIGKTNLLDAIWLICNGKSWSGLMDKQLVRHNEDFYRVTAQIKRTALHEVVVKFQNGKRRAILEDEVKIPKLQQYIGRHPIIMVAPQDDILIGGYSEDRRKMLDHLIAQIDAEYLTHLMGYNHVLKQRNALLKQYEEQPQIDADLLTIYDDQLVKFGEQIFKYRKSTIEALQPLFYQCHQLITKGKDEVKLLYQSHLLLGDFNQKLQDVLRRDRAIGRTSAGLHKDDLVFEIDGNPLKRFGSQGQQKSFIFALKFAMYNYLNSNTRHAPILLIDDLFDKLDMERAEHILSIINDKIEGQIFITDANPERIHKILGGAENTEIFELPL